jgi:hypothetical protein
MSILMDHSTLVSLGHRWLQRRCSIVFTEFATSNLEVPDVIGWRMGSSILIECKVSRSDFRADRNKPIRYAGGYLGMGRRRYFLCPPGMIDVGDLPARWGLLWTKGNRIFLQRDAEPFAEINELSEIRFLVSMLRRAQVRLGKRPLCEWLRIENMPGVS